MATRSRPVTFGRNCVCLENDWQLVIKVTNGGRGDGQATSCVRVARLLLSCAGCRHTAAITDVRRIYESALHMHIVAQSPSARSPSTSWKSSSAVELYLSARRRRRRHRPQQSARTMRRQIVRRSDTSRDVPSRGGNSASATRVDRRTTAAVVVRSPGGDTVAALPCGRRWRCSVRHANGTPSNDLWDIEIRATVGAHRPSRRRRAAEPPPPPPPAAGGLWTAPAQRQIWKTAKTERWRGARRRKPSKRGSWTRRRLEPFFALLQPRDSAGLRSRGLPLPADDCRRENRND